MKPAGWDRGCVKVPVHDYNTPHQIGNVQTNSHASLIKLMIYATKEGLLK